MKAPTEANRIRFSISGYIILWAQPSAIPIWKIPLLSICLMAKISCVLCAKTSGMEMWHGTKASSKENFGKLRKTELREPHKQAGSGFRMTMKKNAAY